MFEIQDAAKVVTESCDPGAKIIFGTVHDEKLKKGEVKITVIASNFPENYAKKSLFPENNTNTQNSNPNKTSESTNTTEKKKDDFTEVQIQKTVGGSNENTEKKLDIIEDDEEWGAVPAFLRRGKK
jgi:cell division protein FtsZ